MPASLPLPFSVTRLLNRNDLPSAAGQVGNGETSVNGETALSNLKNDAEGLHFGICPWLVRAWLGERNEFVHSPQQLYLNVRLKAGHPRGPESRLFARQKSTAIWARQRLIRQGTRASMDV